MSDPSTLDIGTLLDPHKIYWTIIIKKNNAWLHITHKISWKIIKKTMQGCTYEKSYQKINILKN